ncbi:MAG: tetratricopeptide repeat protein [Leptolyngbyaceae cyanobacterium SM2_5_2]|nr:tetratricopeptide repeat protein [Leptolyngbyaceae cyanobacterium SM2_5_2]
MKLSHVVASVIAGLVSAWGITPALAVSTGILSGEMVREASLEPPPLGPETTWLAQNQSSSNLSTAQQEQLDDLLRQGQERVAAKDYAEAIAIYQQAAQIDPQNARILSGIGYLHIQQGDYAEAVAATAVPLTWIVTTWPFAMGWLIVFTTVTSLTKRWRSTAPLWPVTPAKLMPIWVLAAFKFSGKITRLL